MALKQIWDPIRDWHTIEIPDEKPEYTVYGTEKHPIKTDQDDSKNMDYLWKRYNRGEE